jgi:NAD+ synthase
MAGRAVQSRAVESGTTSSKAAPANTRNVASSPGSDKLEIDAKKTIATLEKFLRDFLQETDFDGYVIGLSGGIDSAVSAALAMRAVGPDKIRAFTMPYKSSIHAVKDARLVADWLKIELIELDITKMIDSYYADTKSANPIRVGNKMSRERMAILFDQAFQSRLLVLGTTNRTELALGYFTWFGDSGCSVNALGELYKTQVRQVARELGVPQVILDKPPSADFWAGQVDEDELGLTYEEVDHLLYTIVDEGVLSKSALIKAGFGELLIERTLAFANRLSFKRKCPRIAELGKVEFPDNIVLKK